MDEQQARKKRAQATSEAPQKPTGEQCEKRKTLHRLSLLADARKLGDELLEVWEQEGD